MQTMTEAEIRETMKTHRWTYLLRSPKGVAKYVYAVRKKPRSREQDEVYICPLSKIGELTKAELLAKLAPTPEPNKETSSTDREPEVSNTTDPQTNTDEP